MNWYKKRLKEAGWKSNLFMGLSIPVIATLLGISILKVNKQIEENPQALSQQIQQLQTTDNDLISELNQENIVDTNYNQPVDINLDKIWMIESSKGQDPNMDKNTSGARGHFQFMQNTWNEIVGKMGVNWDWKNGSMDYNKSKQVADYHLNTRIPEMLNYYNIPDSIETRLGAYNWGVGNIKKLWDKYGEDWLKYSPTETQGYIAKYK